MQPESSMDPGQISIQILNEAREMVIITGWAEVKGTGSKNRVKPRVDIPNF